MKKVILDFSNCRYIHDMHQLVKTKLDFPERYGENLDALWDCLTGWIETPVSIEIRGMAAMPPDLQDYAEDFLQVFTDAEERYHQIHIIDKSKT